MILEQIKIFGFRSIHDWIDNFWINKHLTILVGANEHGKTNLLDAISLLGKDNFETSDACRSRSFSPGKDPVPDIEFALFLNRDEKQKIIERLTNIKNQLPAERDEETKKLADRTEKILEDIGQNASPKLKVKVSASGGRRFLYIFQDNSTERWLDYPHNLNQGAKEFFVNMLPEVISFGPSVNFPNSITLAELNNKSSKEWEGLLKLASGVWENKEKLFLNDLNGRDFRAEARGKIQRKLRNIWSQGRQDEADLKVDLELDSSNGHLLLDFIDRTGTRNQPSHRSLGFKSFFSFYLRLYAETTEIDPHGYIFSFDEPGLHLHPSGQKDLLREIRKIAQDNQIIFSTHSPFMIDRHTTTKVMVVSKDQYGTRLDQKPYRKNWAPLKSSLGMVMNDTFFYADKTLLVEGTSDRIFLFSLLQKFSDEFEIDINFLSVIDGDDRGDLQAIARILLAEDRRLVLLVDKDDGGKTLVDSVSDLARSMRKTSNLNAKSYGDLISNRGDASIEDILPAEPLELSIKKYLKDILKVNEEFRLSDINNNGQTLGKALTDHFASKGWTNSHSKFSKTTVADFFTQIFVDYSGSIPEDHPCKIVCSKLKELLDLN